MAGEELTQERDSTRLRADIERTREQLASSVVELRETLARRTDWREWIRRRPGTWLLGGFALGVFLGSRR
jgi:hypothetical protein